jgi:hypothetical protein
MVESQIGANIMVQIDDVLEYINNYYEAALARPEMYATHPQGLEDILVSLEQLRFYILTGETQPSELPYFKFLEAEGFDVANYVTRKLESIKNESELFHLFCLFFRKYLTSDFGSYANSGRK